MTHPPPPHGIAPEGTECDLLGQIIGCLVARGWTADRIVKNTVTKMFTTVVAPKQADLWIARSREADRSAEQPWLCCAVERRARGCDLPRWHALIGNRARRLFASRRRCKDRRSERRVAQEPPDVPESAPNTALVSTRELTTAMKAAFSILSQLRFSSFSGLPVR